MVSRPAVPHSSPNRRVQKQGGANIHVSSRRSKPGKVSQVQKRGNGSAKRACLGFQLRTRRLQPLFQLILMVQH
jgi:hypothetical protein